MTADAADDDDDDLPRPPRQPSALPAPGNLESLQDRIDELAARLDAVESLNKLVEADKFRRLVGYAFYGVGSILPIYSILHVTCLGTHLLFKEQRDLDLPHGTNLTIALWIFYALPLVASLVTAGAFFAIGGRLQMSTTAVERMEHLKAGANGSRKGSTSLQIDLPKAFKLGSSDSE